MNRTTAACEELSVVHHLLTFAGTEGQFRAFSSLSANVSGFQDVRTRCIYLT